MNALTDKLVDAWAAAWAKYESEAERTENERGVNAARQSFGTECDKLSKDYEAQSIAALNAMFTKKAATFADYKRYKFKAGVKLTSTLGDAQK